MWRRGILAAVLLLIHAGLLAWGAARHSPSIDEVGHLPAGISHWQLGRFGLYRVNPPLVRMVAALPVLLAQPETDWRKYNEAPGARREFEIGRDLIAANGRCSFWYFTLARWACIPFSLLGGYVCFRWAGELYGGAAGLLALTLWCFSPNILAHAQMITPDVGATALGVTAAYVYWRWLRQPSVGGAVAAGCLLGLAELTKMTWIVLFALWPLLWGIGRWFRRPAQSRFAWPRETGQLGLMLLLGLLVLNLGYGFEGSFQKLGNYQFVSKMLGGDDNPGEGGNRFAGSWLAAVPVPIPRNHLLGIDRQKHDFEHGLRSYLRGQWQERGWWYYYLYSLAVKVPLGTWLLVLLALALTLAGRLPTAGWREELTLLAPLAVVLSLVSSQTGFNHHLRYVLPIFPFAFLWVSKVAGASALANGKMRLAVASALIGSVASSLWVYPHSLSYFNELAGGPEKGHSHLVDSNIDWGQDLLYLKEWLDEHPAARSLGLAYFGGFDPRLAGIVFTLPPKGPTAADNASDARADELGPQPGWYAVSVSVLRGIHFAVPDGRGGVMFLDTPCYTYFQHFQPIAKAGYSIYVYHITAEEADRVRQKYGLPPLSAVQEQAPRPTPAEDSP